MMINMVLAASFEHPEYPTPFYSRGYTERLVEADLVNSRREQVKVDLLLNSPSRGIALLIEVKSGLNDEARDRFKQQVARYAATTWHDIATTAGITLPPDGDGKFDFVVFVPLGFGADVDAELAGSDPYVCYEADVLDEHGTAMLGAWFYVRGQHSDTDLEALITEPLAAPIPIPDHYLPYDDSSSLQDIAAEIWPYLATRYVDASTSHVTELWLAEQSIPVWDGLGREFQKGIQTRIRKVLTHVSQSRGRPLINWDNSERVWTFDEDAQERGRVTSTVMGIEMMRSFGTEDSQLDVFVDDVDNSGQAGDDAAGTSRKGNLGTTE